ncbi:class I SAM-dependent methyltransferase [Mesorhizobium sp. M4A.F.Ca.ET.050.02.1.1]|uniref:class I SAM-dependent methyltransferase n=1 Tax=Mesorhizobium sp. M4A.F.Ca.ET.050.02.1.1 TaxID=2496754 RepID=UPI0032B02337
MSEKERCFILGLLSVYKPRKILEVGVSSGASSALLLQASDADARVHSIDISSQYYLDVWNNVPKQKQRDTGFLVGHHFPELISKWQIYTNGMVSSHIEQIGGGIDFVLLDAAHGLPGELLDFLTILPFVTEDCVFVLHDISLNLVVQKTKSIAPKLLMCTVSAVKIYPRTKLEHFNTSNIGAFIVNEETRDIDDLRDLFLALTLDWVVPITDYKMAKARKILDRYYPEELVALYDVATKNHVMQREPAKQASQSLRPRCEPPY